MPTQRYPSIPDPSLEPEALRRSDVAIKETLEIMTGVRGNRNNSVVTWQDLIDLGFIVPTQVPK
jgi:hypothetical protein